LRATAQKVEARAKTLEQTLEPRMAAFMKSVAKEMAKLLKQLEPVTDVVGSSAQVSFKLRGKDASITISPDLANMTAFVLYKGKTDWGKPVKLVLGNDAKWTATALFNAIPTKLLS